MKEISLATARGVCGSAGRDLKPNEGSIRADGSTPRGVKSEDGAPRCGSSPGCAELFSGGSAAPTVVTKQERRDASRDSRRLEQSVLAARGACAAPDGGLSACFSLARIDDVRTNSSALEKCGEASCLRRGYRLARLGQLRLSTDFLPSPCSQSRPPHHAWWLHYAY